VHAKCKIQDTLETFPLIVLVFELNFKVTNVVFDVNFEGHLSHSEVTCRLATFLILFFAC